MTYSSKLHTVFLLGMVLWLTNCSGSSFEGASGTSPAKANTADKNSTDQTPNTNPSDQLQTGNKSEDSGTSPATGNIGDNSGTSPDGTPSTVPVSSQSVTALCQAKLAVALVMDVSGSMAADPNGSATGDIIQQIFGGSSGSSKTSKIQLAITSAQTFLGGFNKNAADQVGLVEFSQQATVLSQLTTNIPLLSGYVTQMKPQTTTNIYDGLLKAVGVLQPLLSDASYKKFVILMSDGMHNQSGDPVAEAALIKGAGVTIYTVGFTASAGISELQAIASGSNFFINAADGPGLVTAFNTIAAQLCR